MGSTSGRPRVGAPEGPGGDEAAVERGERRGDLGFAGGVEGGREGGGDPVEDGAHAGADVI